MSDYTNDFENKLHDFLNRGQTLTIGNVPCDIPVMLAYRVTRDASGVIDSAVEIPVAHGGPDDVAFGGVYFV